MSDTEITAVVDDDGIDEVEAIDVPEADADAEELAEETDEEQDEDDEEVDD